MGVAPPAPAALGNSGRAAPPATVLVIALRSAAGGGTVATCAGTSMYSTGIALFEAD